METAVLPAQDHLARERYRHQSRVMSGMIYPLETVSRTRRKVRSPPSPRESNPVSSISTESARLSYYHNTQAAAAAAVAVAAPSIGASAVAVDMAMGILRSAPSPASTPTHSPSAAVRNNQYRSHHGNGATTQSQGFISHESGITSQKQQLTASPCSFSSPPESTTGVSGAPQFVLRTRSEGELSQGRKPQKDTVDRISSKNLSSKKSVENVPEKNVEKSSDRRKSSERKAFDKKFAANNSNQAEKTSTLQKKGSEVDRLTDRSKVVEPDFDSSVLIENVPYGKAVEHTSTEKVVDRLCEKKKASERKVVERKSTAVGKTNQGDRISNIHNGQKKVGVITILQRPQTVEAAAENLAKITGRALEACTLQVLNQQKLSPTLEHGSAKPLATTTAKAAPSSTVSQSVEAVAVSKEEVETVRNGNASTVSPKKAGKKKPSREHVGKGAVPRTTAETVHVDVRNTKGVVKHQLRSASAPEERDVTKREAGNNGGPIRSSSLDQGVSDLIKLDSRVAGGASAFATGVPLSLPGESFKGEVGQLGADSHVRAKRSENFREVSRANSDSSVELFVSSLPPKSCERWAGPAYTNSPPPSTLPFPTFPIQRLKSSLTAVTLPNHVVAEEAKTPTKSSSAPSSPSRASSSSIFCTSAFQVISIDPMSATKDLRRILNLEVDGDALGAVSKCSEEVSTSLAKGEELGTSLSKQGEVGSSLAAIMNDFNFVQKQTEIIREHVADASSRYENSEHMRRVRDSALLRDEKGDELLKEWEQANAATRSLKRILQLPN